MNVAIERGITAFKTTRIQKIPTYQIILWWAGPEECRLTQRSQVLMQLQTPYTAWPQENTFRKQEAGFIL